MSYARFFDSDVYVFRLGNNCGFRCQACSLTPMVNSIFTKGSSGGLFGIIEPCKYCSGAGCQHCQEHGNTTVQTRREMIEHLKVHISQGDRVGDAIRRLEMEIAELE